MKVTKAQLKSYKRVCRMQGKLPLARYLIDEGNGYVLLFVNFGYIFIGIEPDGYAHS